MSNEPTPSPDAAPQNQTSADNSLNTSPTEPVAPRALVLSDAPPPGAIARGGFTATETERDEYSIIEGDSETVTDAALVKGKATPLVSQPAFEPPRVNDEHESVPDDDDHSLYDEPSSNESSYDEPEADYRSGEQDLFEHLTELRTRLLRCVIAVTIGMVVMWTYRVALLEFFAAPIVRALKAYGGVATTTGPMQGFLIYMQTVFTASLLLVLPYVLWQIWAFVEPALTHQERRYSKVLVPFSVILFFGGAALGFFISPKFFEFFLQFQPPGTAAFWSYADSATFLAKMLLVFGICFQVPVVTIFANKIGLVSRNWLIDHWRHVMIGIFIMVAIITPTPDPVTLTAAALPPCLLYLLSIWIVKWL